MRLKEFTHSDITVKYAYLRSKSGSKKAFLVVLSNPFEKDGTVEFLQSLAAFDVPRLFIAAAKDYQYGMHFVKNQTLAPRDAILELIENTRIENEIAKSNTYLIGFCMAAQPALAMAIENGYNLIITEYIYGGSLAILWDKSDPESISFKERKAAAREPKMDHSYIEFFEKFQAYSGIDADGFTLYIRNHLEEKFKKDKHKFSVPNIYLLGGKYEESWRLFGKMTVDKLNSLGLNLEVTISDEIYGHMEAIPHFIKYFTEKLRKLGL